MQPDDVRRLQALFIKADEDGDGALSLDEFKSVLLHAAGTYDRYVVVQLEFVHFFYSQQPHISLLSAISEK